MKRLSLRSDDPEALLFFAPEPVRIEYRQTL